VEAITLEPIMEPIIVEGRINGQQVIADLLDRIGERLSRDCSLRQIDSYAKYGPRHD